mmetsp:Transcript_107566/g.343171  ORF Transcript_107566/g.343171 Transcript_107566/m.343171 type:complete len:406 (+) Transcript_107566:4227-5444(+)
MHRHRHLICLLNEHIYVLRLLIAGSQEGQFGLRHLLQLVLCMSDLVGHFAQEQIGGNPHLCLLNVPTHLVQLLLCCFRPLLQGQDLLLERPREALELRVDEPQRLRERRLCHGQRLLRLLHALVAVGAQGCRHHGGFLDLNLSARDLGGELLVQLLRLRALIVVLAHGLVRRQLLLHLLEALLEGAELLDGRLLRVGREAAHRRHLAGDVAPRLADGGLRGADTLLGLLDGLQHDGPQVVAGVDLQGRRGDRHLLNLVLCGVGLLHGRRQHLLQVLGIALLEIPLLRFVLCALLLTLKLLCLYLLAILYLQNLFLQGCLQLTHLLTELRHLGLDVGGGLLRGQGLHGDGALRLGQGRGLCGQLALADQQRGIVAVAGEDLPGGIEGFVHVHRGLGDLHGSLFDFV